MNIDHTTFTSSHPGTSLLGLLQFKGMTQKDLANIIGKSTPFINEIIKERKAISVELAILLEAALGEVTAAQWLEMQNAYDLELARKENTIKLQKKYINDWNELKKFINVTYLKKNIPLSGPIEKDIQFILDLGGFKSVEEINDSSTSCSGHFRKSESFKPNPINLYTWTLLARHRSTIEPLNTKFDIDNLEDLTKKLNSIFYTNKDTFMSCKETLARYGIKLIHLEKLEKVPVDGYTFWEGENPTIVMTIRYNRIDNFAFTLHHELGHVCSSSQENHHDRQFIYSKDSVSKTAEEVEADDFATKQIWGTIPYKDLFSKISPCMAPVCLQELSRESKINVGIVTGQYQYYRYRRNYADAYSICKNLQQKVL